MARDGSIFWGSIEIEGGVLLCGWEGMGWGRIVLTVEDGVGWMGLDWIGKTVRMEWNGIEWDGIE